MVGVSERSRENATASRLRSLLAFTSLIAILLVVSSRSNRSDTHLLRRHLSTEVEDIFGRAVQESSCTKDCCVQYEEEICATDDGWVNAVPFAWQVVLIVLLICLSATFSGLTLGLMGLDKTGLEIGKKDCFCVLLNSRSLILSYSPYSICSHGRG